MLEVVTSTSLTKNINFWGFTDLYGVQNSGSTRFDLTDHFMEYRLDYESLTGLDIEAEYNGFSGPGNDLVRLGLSHVRPIRGGWVSFRYFPWDTRAEKHEHYSVTHFIPIAGKFAFFGFYDYHRLTNQRNVWYTEPSLIYELNKKYSLILIWRHDGFVEDVPGLKADGLAFGVYMKI